MNNAKGKKIFNVSVLRRLFSVAAPYRKKFYLSIILSVVLALMAPLRPLLIQLTINQGRAEPYDLGNGYGHLAVSVPDVAAEHARMEAAGLEPRKIVDFAPGGSRIEIPFLGG